MLENSIESLTNFEKGNTIHIISSGPSLEFYTPQNSDPTICIDYSFSQFNSQYIITRCHHLLHNALTTGRVVVTSELDFGKKGFHRKLILTNPISNLYLYKSDLKSNITIDAINFAILLGSNNIILHGSDYPFRGGTYPGYPGSISSEEQEKEYPLILKRVFELQNQVDIKFDGITNEMILPYSKRILKNNMASL